MTTDPDPTPPDPGVGPLTPGALIIGGAEALITFGSGVYTAAGLVGLAAAGTAGAGGTAIAAYARRGRRTSASRGPTQTPGRSTRAARAGRPGGTTPTRAGSTAARPRPTSGRTATTPTGRSAGRPASSTPTRTGSTGSRSTRRRPSLFASRQPAAGTGRRRSGLRLPTLGLSLPGWRSKTGRPGSTPARGHGSAPTRTAGRPRQAARRLADLGRRLANPTPARRSTRPAPTPTGRVRPHVQAPPGVQARPATRPTRPAGWTPGRPHARPGPAVTPPTPTRPAVRPGPATTRSRPMAIHFPRPKAAELLEEAAAEAARLDPQSMREVMGWIDAYPAMTSHVHRMFSAFGAAAAERFPLGPASRGVLDNTTRVAYLISQGATEVPPAVYREHEILIRRFTDSVIGDELWDIRGGQ